MRRAPMLLLAALLHPGSVHPLHTTHTELLESASGEVTVAVRAFSDDLLAALRRRGPESGDSAIAHYVGATLQLQDATGRAVALRLVRVEQDGAVTWMHFAATVPGGLAGARIRPTMQSELYPDQVNVVRAVYRGREQSLLFLRGDGVKTLP
jgi:hypothetical protein